jgi:FeS assembly SUF system regulator
MFRLSKRADYALMALAYLAEVPTSVASAREIAMRYDASAELLAKVLQRLAQYGLVVSQMGVHGGYRLARPSNSISVADVVDAIDGPVALTACSLGDERCGQFSKCSVRDPLWRLKSRIQSVLTTMSVEEMVQAVAR